MPGRGSFTNNQRLFREHTLAAFEHSTEYVDLAPNIDAILTICDRVIVACQGHPEVSRVEELAALLDDLEDRIESRGLDILAEDLISKVEHWLKAIAWLLGPAFWNDAKKLTLHPLIIRLGLLTQDELNTDITQANLISDEARQFMFLTKKFRNPIIHNTYAFRVHERAQFLTVALVTLLAPVFKYREELSQRLRGLIAAPLSEQTMAICRSAASERRAHLDHFAARADWVSSLRDKLESPNRIGGYILLTGGVGSGKSALVSKLTDEVGQIFESLGQHASSVTNVAPWLPRVLLHFGKQSNRPDEIVQFLVDQANTMLLTPVVIPDLHDTRHRAAEALLNFEHLQKGALVHETIGGPDEVTGLQNEVLRFLKSSRTTENHLLQRTLYSTLERLVEERGEVVLIIDAIDEISPDGFDLSFLPGHLPPGVTALLTSRPGASTDALLANLRIAEHLSLDNLKRIEIPLITGVEDIASDDHRAFNNRVWKQSAGWALLVAGAAQSVRHHGGDFRQATVDASVDSILERQANEWAVTPMLTEALILLAVSEPVAPLELEVLQGYLAHRGYGKTLAELRRDLRPYGSQLQGLDVGRIKLTQKPFADYVRDTFCSRRDLRSSLQLIVAWLGSDHEVPATLLAGFLQHWTDPIRTKKDPNLRSITLGLILALEQVGAADRLFRIADELLDEEGVPADLAIECLEKSAALGSSKGRLTLAIRLLDGAGIPRDIDRGEQLLIGQANTGSVEAMLELGSRLADGEGLPHSPAQGFEWLNKAAQAGDRHAKAILGIRLAFGIGLLEDSTRGEELLHEAAADGVKLAVGALGDYLLMNARDEQAVVEGEALLRRAAQSGQRQAMVALGSRLVTGDTLNKNTSEGERWLRKAAELGYNPARIELGEHLLDETSTATGSQEGLELLKLAAESGDVHGMIVLGSRLCDGRGLPQDRQGGEQWFIRAADTNDLRAMVILCTRLIDGRNVRQSPAEGVRYLQLAAERGHTGAALTLGVRYLDGRGLSQNSEQGERWIRRAIDHGDVTAMTVLGQRLVDGHGVPQDLTAGESWLRLAIDNGSIAALGVLGSRILEGDIPAKHEGEGQSLIEIAIEKGDIESMRFLATSYLDDGNPPENAAKARELLRKAAERGDLASMYLLGVNLIEGITPDRVAGLEYLEKACLRGHSLSGVYIGMDAYARGEYPRAATSFLRAFQMGNDVAGNDLAYMKRRGELPAGFISPSISELLQPAIARHEEFAILNEALCYASGMEFQESWETAHELVMSLTPEAAANLVEWWHKIAQQGDAEGDLVLGWLASLSLATDPDGVSPMVRFDRAQGAGWRVPTWLSKGERP